MIMRKRGNFVLNKADFRGVAGSYDEENQRRQHKSCRLQPIDEFPNTLLKPHLRRIRNFQRQHARAGAVHGQVLAGALRAEGAGAGIGVYFL
jgi:hypothetical protein